MRFSNLLIQEYQAEMLASYGTTIATEDAQLELYSLVRCLFGASGGAGAGTLVRYRRAVEVGDSITPTSGHLDK